MLSLVTFDFYSCQFGYFSCSVLYVCELLMDPPPCTKKKGTFPLFQLHFFIFLYCDTTEFSFLFMYILFISIHWFSYMFFFLFLVSCDVGRFWPPLTQFSLVNLDVRVAQLVDASNSSFFPPAYYIETQSSQHMQRMLSAYNTQNKWNTQVI